MLRASNIQWRRQHRDSDWKGVTDCSTLPGGQVSPIYRGEFLNCGQISHNVFASNYRRLRGLEHRTATTVSCRHPGAKSRDLLGNGSAGAKPPAGAQGVPALSLFPKRVDDDTPVLHFGYFMAVYDFKRPPDQLEYALGHIRSARATSH